MTLVVGTAGHIDHGKTTLLRALTGIDADRLPEERRRGMTIDVGYAHMSLAGGREIDFVDVPGHDRLVGNMLVGAGEIDAAMLVVAADDGPRPQTVEHLELLDALSVDRGVAAVTKTDLVSPDRVSNVARAVTALLARTTLARAPVVAVSAATGDGLDALRAELGRLEAAIPRADEADGAAQPRLAVDRVFTVRGRGLVVTGSLRGGRVRAGDTLLVVPGNRPARVREVQVHGRGVDEAGPGRVALNLAGPPADAIGRGAVLAGPGVVEATDRLLVALRPPARLGEQPTSLPSDRSRLRLHAGTDQVDATVGRGGREAVALDAGRAAAILRLERPVAVAAGDRLVLRRPSPGATAAAGVVLDASPPRGAARRRASPERLTRLDRAAAAGVAGEIAAARLALHGGLVGGGRVTLAGDVRAAVREDVMAAVAAGGGRDDGTISLPAARAVAERALRRSVGLDGDATGTAAAGIVDGLVGDGSLERDGARLGLPGRRAAGPTPAETAAMDRLLAALDVSAPPPLAVAARAAGCSEMAVRSLERTGRIVSVGDDIAWSAAAWRRLATTALGLASAGPLTPAALRDATGTSRKYVMALLEDLNRRGVLTRTGDGHRPGPRAATLAAPSSDGPPRGAREPSTASR